MIVVFDLDDTLYPELEFVKSGYRAVARFLDPDHEDELYDVMWSEFVSGDRRKIFNMVLDKYSFSVTVKECVNEYWFHKPDIQLDPTVRDFLNTCKSKWTLGLITDGPQQMQRQKFDALGLDTVIDFPVFTDALGTSKPDEIPYRHIMNECPSDSYVYISDNPKKDFVAPQALGWHSVRVLRENGIYRDIETPSGIPEISSVVEAMPYLEEWG